MGRFRSPIARGFTVACLCCAACAEPAAPLDPVLVGASSEPILYGSPEDGELGVVMVYDQAYGAMCTGTLIAPRVVVTAKHCVYMEGAMVPASAFIIGIGPTGTDDSYLVSDVRSTPGAWDDYCYTDCGDIAVLILTSAASEAPYASALTLPAGFNGSTVTMIGYGQTEGGSAGRKYRTTDTVIDFWATEFMTAGDTACFGDSGGPVFDSQMVLTGVISRGTEYDCASSQVILTRVDAFRSLINQALSDTGACVPTGAEVCGDATDNDCNGEVDEGCKALGEPCAGADECSDGECLDLGAGPVCTRTCDPDAASCPSGSYCKRISCGGDGGCAPGAAGAGVTYAPCAVDTDCASLLCADSGTGHGLRCLEPCTMGAGGCLPGEACHLWDAICGYCISASETEPPRYLGEPCEIDGDCASSRCLDDDGERYCSQECGDGCPAGFHCRGDLCARGTVGELGDPCLEDGDCASGRCLEPPDGRPFCTTPCADDGQCPASMGCGTYGAERVCLPERGVSGELCEEATDCISNRCTSFSGEFSCSEACGRGIPCPPTMGCWPSDTGDYACAPNGTEHSHIVPDEPTVVQSGCAVAGGSPALQGPGAAPPLLPVLALGFALPIALRRGRRSRG